MMEAILEFFPMAPKEDILALARNTATVESEEAICALQRDFWRKHDGISLMGISATALTRYQSNDPEFTWDHKILGISELDGAATANVILRCLSSEGGGTTLVTEKTEFGKFYTQMYSTSGRPMLFATTASDEIEHQFSNRCFMIEMDPADLKAVHMKIAERYNGKQKKTKAKEIREEIRTIPKYVDVMIPYAERIAKMWHTYNVVSSRTLQDFFRLIHGVTILHYKHRKTKNHILMSTPQDYDLARQIFCGLKVKLSGPTLKTLHAIQDMEKTYGDEFMRVVHRPDELVQEVKGFTVEEISDHALKSGSQAYKDVTEMMNQGLLKRVKWKVDEISRKPYLYFTSEYARKGTKLPSWKELTGRGTKAYIVKGCE